MSVFRFRRFSVENERSPMKVNTDGVLLGAAMTLRPEDKRLLDIGTGTGCIALMAAQRLSDLSGDFLIEGIDIDEAAASEAAHNFSASPWGDRLEAGHISMQELSSRLGPAQAVYDVIFSNPPFFDDSLRNPDEREALSRHTTSLGYPDILVFASSFLKPAGRLSLIVPFESQRHLVRLAASYGLYPFRRMLIRTTPSKPVRRLIAEFSRERFPETVEELTLKDGECRSEAYSVLTKDFYL